MTNAIWKIEVMASRLTPWPCVTTVTSFMGKFFWISKERIIVIVTSGTHSSVALGSAMVSYIIL